MSKYLIPFLLIVLSCNDASFSEDSTVKKTETKEDIKWPWQQSFNDLRDAITRKRRAEAE